MMAAHISPYGGSWYPRQKSELNTVLDTAFDDSRRRTGLYVLPRVRAIVVPHAAPCYSGTVAAAAYRHLQATRPERVYILGFSHRRAVRGIAIPDVKSYRTPLGDIAVDSSTVRGLCAVAPFYLADEREVCDHSVEIQLPFLQRAAPAAAVIPVYVGQLEDGEWTEAAGALARMWRPGDVFVASSDLTHYGRRFHYVPFRADRQIAARLRELDRSVIDAASGIDSDLFLKRLCQSGATACGRQPIALLLRTLSLIDAEDIFEQELDYQASGEITGDFSETVSYAAIGYFHRSSFELNELERNHLMLIARATLRHLVETGERAVVPPLGLPAVSIRAPVFVSIHRAGHLLGCVGRLSHSLPLSDEVPEVTLAAALDDPRRAPSERITSDAEIEISVLTPMKLVRGVEAIRIGRDGAFVECGAHSGLLLPQVAGRGWTAARFVDILLRKAGLGPRALGAPGMRLFVFQAQVFRG
jgi:AmmeMemoRadiSam system protein B/AmmeMemoRadiSam system protein A